MATYTPPDPQHMMNQDLKFLREYARRVILEEDESFTALEDVKEDLLDEVWKVGKSLGFTERDLALLLYKGVLPECP